MILIMKALANHKVILVMKKKNMKSLKKIDKLLKNKQKKKVRNFLKTIMSL